MYRYLESKKCIEGRVLWWIYKSFSSTAYWEKTDKEVLYLKDRVFCKGCFQIYILFTQPVNKPINSSLINAIQLSVVTPDIERTMVYWLAM